MQLMCREMLPFTVPCHPYLMSSTVFPPIETLSKHIDLLQGRETIRIWRTRVGKQTATRMITIASLLPSLPERPKGMSNDS